MWIPGYPDIHPSYCWSHALKSQAGNWPVCICLARIIMQGCEGARGKLGPEAAVQSNAAFGAEATLLGSLYLHLKLPLCPSVCQI